MAVSAQSPSQRFWKSPMKRMHASLMFCAVAAVAVNADAHGIWFAQRSDELAMIYGEGAEDANIVKRLANVRSIAAYDAAGATVVTKLVATDYLLLVDRQAQPAVVTAVLDNGLWTQTPDGHEVNKARSEVPGAKGSGRYLKYAVHLLGDLKTPLNALAGQTLQIAPVNAALPQHRGDALTLRVLFEGKPLAGAEVLTDFVNDPDGRPLRTGKDGTVTLKVRNQGLNVISVVHDAPPDNPAEADKLQHRATLSFVLAATGD